MPRATFGVHGLLMSVITFEVIAVEIDFYSAATLAWHAIYGTGKWHPTPYSMQTQGLPVNDLSIDRSHNGSSNFPFQIQGFDLIDIVIM